MNDVAEKAERFARRNKLFSRWMIRGGWALACILIVIAAAYLYGVQTQRAAVKELKGRGVHVMYEPVDDTGNWIHKDRPMWMSDLLDNDWFASPSGANASDSFDRIDPRALELLSRLPRLKGLVLARASIDDLSFLSGLRNLRLLELSATGVGNEDLVHLQEHDRLTRLSLAFTAVSDEGLSEIAKLSNLEIIDLSHTLVTAEGVAQLQAALPLAKIISTPFHSHEHGRACAQIMRGGGSVREGKDWIDSNRTSIGVITSDDTIPKYGLHAWRGSTSDFRGLPEIQGLARVFVNPNYLGPDKWTLLAACHDLNVLGFENGNLSDEELSNLERLPGLRQLTIERCRITDEALRHIGSISSLTSLSLAQTAITDQGLAALANLGCLERLYLSGTGVGDAGMSYVGELSELNYLNLSKTAVGDEGLARLRGLSTLDMLNLRETGVTDSGLVHLHGMSLLKRVDLYKSKVSRAGVEKLKAAIPGIDVTGP